MTSTRKYLLAILLGLPLLISGCLHDDDDDDDDVPVIPIDEAAGTDVSAIFALPADAEPMPLDDPEALEADIEATFGAPDEEPREPGEILDLADG